MTIEGFSPATRAWFASTYPGPTRAQALGWASIAAGQHTLLLAPTGSGKTLAAFLWAIDRMSSEPVPAERERRTRVLYVSPMRALAVDVEKNLRAPLAGIGADVSVGVRTGDTDARERRRLLSHPPDILITTPESLYLMLTSSARETFRGLETVIVDEIHAVAASKRGAHLMLSLERLEEVADGPVQRIGLSATQRPLEEIGRFLGGFEAPGRPRPVQVIDAGTRKELDLEVIVPIDDMASLAPTEDRPQPRPGTEIRSIWPSIHPVLLDLIRSHGSTIVFVNSRRSAERLAERLNDLAEEDLVRAHHGSLARERRLEVEDALKDGRLRAIVATSSLELGIDMGAVDLVVQVEAPGSVASGMQRIGRGGHHVGAPSVGKLIPKYRGDLLQTAVVTERMLSAEIEETRYPRNPLDVLAQQIVAMTAVDEWRVDDLLDRIRCAAPFAELSDAVFTAVLDMLSGRYPSDSFAELRPRIVWDREAGTVTARQGAGQLAVTSGGTIPDRGLFPMFTTDGSRVGELDEECVYESRAGEVMLLGASSWRIEEITLDRVVVTPAPGETGKLPFWKAPGPGRPVELGRAIGAFTRRLRAADPADAAETLRERLHLDGFAVDNLLAYLRDEAESTGGSVPDDRTIVVERFPDELGDWRVCILSPLGARVHAPWALAIEARLLDRFGPGAQVLWSDDGIVLRLPEAVDRIPVDDLVFDPDEIEATVVSVLPTTPLFSSVFREAAARALLLPRRRPGKRTPMWQQRQRSADLLAAASSHPEFPILLEATRECLRDHFDVPALRELMGDLRSRRIRIAAVDTDQASPFAQSLLFKWISVFMYEGDAPLAERRAAALALDRDLLRELLGGEELRELLDPTAIDEVELELQRLAPGRRARGLDGVHDLLRELGPMPGGEVAPRTDGDAAGFADRLVEDRRAIRFDLVGHEYLAAVEDAALVRDGLDVPIGGDVPSVFLEDVDRPVEVLVARFVRRHGPFLTDEAAAALGLPPATVLAALETLDREGAVLHGEFRPLGTEREWCDPNVLRRIRRRSLAALRREVEPVDAAAFARFLPAWQGADRPQGGADALPQAVARLQGAPIPASILEADVMPARVRGFRPADLDALVSSGELLWVGAGALGASDGRVALVYRDRIGSLAPSAPGPDDPDRPDGPLHDAIRALLLERGASFWPDLVSASGTADPRVVLRALWDLVWAGEVTNDTLAPLRAFLSGTGLRRPRAGPPPRPRPGALRAAGPPAGAGRWSLVPRSPAPADAASVTTAVHALAGQLLDRHGVLTREAVLAEGAPGGFAGVYPVLKAMEEAGSARRGYFVAGLGAAQFSLPGAVDRLRALRETSGEPVVTTLAAADPAQPYGAALPWPTSPGRPARAAGAFVVLIDGEPAAYLERGARTLTTFEHADPTPVADAIAALVKDGRLRRVELRSIDQRPSEDHDLATALRDAGFMSGYRGLTCGG